MGLSPKGSKSSINKASNAFPKYAPSNKIDQTARIGLSKGAVSKGAVIKVPGEIIAMAHPKTKNKATATSIKRSNIRGNK